MKNKILNITNGDSSVIIMEQADIPGDFLPWRDVLHEGPVPKDLSLDKLSQCRAKFIVQQGWGHFEDINNGFVQRDKTLKSFNSYQKVILWFEHDLYDQLQILQILDWFSQQDISKVSLSMICTDNYLGMLSPHQMKALVVHEKPVTKEQLALSKNAWAAFRDESPQVLVQLAELDTSAMPFLKDAIVRLLEEYPNEGDGLSRIAKKALQVISQGETQPGKVFALYQETEDKKFLGDSSFFNILNEMLIARYPLISLQGANKLKLPISPDQELTITVTGEEVLSGRKNWLDLSEIDRWIGGVHLTPGNHWFWDARARSLIKAA